MLQPIQYLNFPGTFICIKILEIYRSLRERERERERFVLCAKIEPTRDRTWNLLIRSQAPYPFGHRSLLLEEVLLKVSTAVAIQPFHFYFQFYLKRYLYSRYKSLMEDEDSFVQMQSIVFNYYKAGYRLKRAL